MLSKVKDFCKVNGKAFFVSMMVAIMTVFSSISCFADDEANTDALKTAFNTGLSNVSDEILGYLALVVPVAIAIVVAYIAVRKGITFLRGLIGK